MKRHHLIHALGVIAAALLTVGIADDAADPRVLGMLGLLVYVGERRLTAVQRRLDAVTRPNAAAYELGAADGFREGWEARGEHARPTVVALRSCPTCSGPDDGDRRRPGSPLRTLAQQQARN